MNYINLQDNGDVVEDEIQQINPKILEMLLKDKSTQQNIIWATDDYESFGEGYNKLDQIRPELITKENSYLIQPRASKSKEVQENRIKARAEVFTPSWICNQQNNQVDEAWFGTKEVFNVEEGNSWTTKRERIDFEGLNKDWKAYVTARRLEITCGEAPYLFSRYDTTTGEMIPLADRIGLFDRKMRVVSENCKDDEEWIEWSLKALKSIYGYDFQGDNVLLARENMLCDYLDYFLERFNKLPDMVLLRKVTNVIAWNIWQMDGLKGVVPYSCHDVKQESQLSLFEESEEVSIPCPGCTTGNINKHSGIYCRIYDWLGENNSVTYVSMLRGGRNNG